MPGRQQQFQGLDFIFSSSSGARRQCPAKIHISDVRKIREESGTVMQVALSAPSKTRSISASSETEPALEAQMQENHQQQKSVCMLPDLQPVFTCENITNPNVKASRQQQQHQQPPGRPQEAPQK